MIASSGGRGRGKENREGEEISKESMLSSESDAELRPNSQTKSPMFDQLSQVGAPPLHIFAQRKHWDIPENHQEPRDDQIHAGILGCL